MNDLEVHVSVISPVDHGDLDNLGQRNGMSSRQPLGNVNHGFVGDGIRTLDRVLAASEEKPTESEKGSSTDRPQWGNGLEFLMSCIAMSVGLGNIWRFPFTAYENGGGAFLIPYIIVLAVVGRPLYLLEMALGQFTSKGTVQIWSVAPVLMGVGYGQVIASACVLTYYCALMAITLHYLVASFQAELPWSKCLPSWDNCFDSVSSNSSLNATSDKSGLRSSSELYFLKQVLHEKDGIDDGIGLPDWQLTVCLFVSWVFIFLLLVKGVQSSGKAAYFLALFPYVVLTCLLVRGVTLPGALNGILFFITPQWDTLLSPKVWYAAVTQVFYSLSVCFGALITYSSYNNFRHNIYRDAMIVTVLDTVTSLIAGCTIFGILGNLAYESGSSDISTVTKGGTGLAFISYPDAIAKFEIVPQAFSVLFFFMLYVLGLGSAVSMQGGIVTIFTDQFPKLKYWTVALVLSLFGFVGGLVYVTPGGQYMLNLVDYFAGSFSVFILASMEAIGIFWIYGLGNFCDDLEFMLNMKIGLYWRLCWGLFTPVLLLVILIYSIAIASPLTYKDHIYPSSAYGWTLMTFGIAQLPLWGLYVICKNRQGSLLTTIKAAFTPSELWGPQDQKQRKEWEQFKRKRMEESSASVSNSSLVRMFRLFYPK